MFKRMLCYDLHRCMGKVSYWAKIPLISAVCFFSNAVVLEEMFTNHISDWDDLIGIYNFIIHFDRFRVVLLVLLASLYTNSYCVDTNHHYFNFLRARVSLKIYTMSRVVSNAISIFVAYFLGILVYLCILHQWYPLVNREAAMTGSDNYLSFASLPPEEHPVLLILLLSFQMVALAIMLSNVGFLISVYMPDSFIAVSVPAVAYFVLGCITGFLPELFYFPSYSNSAWLFSLGMYGNYVVKMLVLIGGSIVSSIAFYKLLRKRWDRNGGC